MHRSTWQSRVTAAVLSALAALLLLGLTRPDISFRVDDYGHLAFSRSVAERAAGESAISRPFHLLSGTLTPEMHFSHVHPGRPVTNLFRVLLYLVLGENPGAWQTVLLLLLVLLTAQLAELGAWLSGRAAGGLLCALLFISCPPVAGLLAWTSHLNLVLGLVLATAGLRLVLGFVRGGARAGLWLGIPLLLAAMLTRETELFVIPAILAAAALAAGPLRELGCWRRLGPALLFLAVPLLLWCLPAFRARSGGGVPFADPALTWHLARITFLAQAGTVLKALAWFLLLPLALVRPGGGEAGGLSVAGGRAGLLVLVVAVAVLFLLPGGTVHVWLLVLALSAALFTAGGAVTTGLVWAAAAGLPILIYGAFAGRYAVEPLFGLCLALAPLLGAAVAGLSRHRGRWASAALLGLLLFQLLFNICPDTLTGVVGKPGLLRRSGHWGEALVRSAELRAAAFDTFAGRVPGGWRQVKGWRHLPNPDDPSASRTLFLWHDPAGRYLRLGTFYSPMEPEQAIWAVALEGKRSWEWNRWFWRSSLIKGPGRMLPSMGGRRQLAAAGGGAGGEMRPLVASLWAGDDWYPQRLVAAVPEMSDAEAGLALFLHYRGVAEGLGANERQAMILFETARLFLREDGRCDDYEKHLLDRIALGW